MGSRITRQPLGITIVLFTALVLFFHMRHLVTPLPEEAVVQNLTPFGSIICRWLEGMPYVEAMISVALILMTAIVIARLVSRNLVFSARTYVFLIFLVIIGYGIFIRSGNLPAVAAAFLIAKASECFTYAFKRTAHMYESFKGSLMLGLAPLIYAPAAVYLPISLIAMPIYMRGGRETTVALSGLLFPMFAWSYVAWILGEPFLQYFTDLYNSLLTTGAGLPLIDSTSISGIARITLLALLGTGVAMSLATYFRYARTLRTRAFRIYQYMIFLMLAGIGGMFLPCASIGDLPLISIGLSVIAAKYFSRHNGLVPNLIYISTIIAAVVYNLIFII